MPLYRGDNEFSILTGGTFTFKTVSPLDDVEVIPGGGVAEDEVLEGHVPAVLVIDEGRNGRILGDMPHPHLTGDVVQKGRTAAVDHIL